MKERKLIKKMIDFKRYVPTIISLAETNAEQAKFNIQIVQNGPIIQQTFGNNNNIINQASNNLELSNEEIERIKELISYSKEEVSALPQVVTILNELKGLLEEKDPKKSKLKLA